MYLPRWLRPGPGLVAIAAAAGFLLGSILGLAIPPGTREGPAAEPFTPTSSATAQTQPTLPTDRPFYTVILASLPVSGGRAAAEQRVEDLQARVGEQVQIGLLDPEHWDINQAYYAVYSGTFESSEEARRGIQELVQLGACPGPGQPNQCYPRLVRAKT